MHLLYFLSYYLPLKYVEYYSSKYYFGVLTLLANVNSGKL